MKQEIEQEIAVHQQWLASGCIDGRPGRLEHADLSQAHLDGLDLRHAKLRGARLMRAGLRGARLDHADLRGADLSYAELSGASLEGARASDSTFDGAVLDGANCRHAQFQRASMLHLQARRADFEQADLRAADLTLCQGGAARLVRTSFVGAVLDGAQFDEADFSQAVGTNMSMRGTRARRARFVGARLAYAQMRGVDLAGSVLDEADLQSCNMGDANLAGISVTRARFTYGTLAGASLAGVRFEDAQFDQLRSDAGALPRANLDSDVPARQAVGSGRLLRGQFRRMGKVTGLLAIGSLALGLMCVALDAVLIGWAGGSASAGLPLRYLWLFALAAASGIGYFVLLRTGFEASIEMLGIAERSSSGEGNGPAEPAALELSAPTHP